jgi:molybdopterin-guanine dinucleotide biosynthesis protein A
MKNNIAFALLAGGKSERMGTPKGLLEYNNHFWIIEQLQRIDCKLITEVYIGLGFDYENYFKEIPWLKTAQIQFVTYKNLSIRIVINKNPVLGPFSTLQSVLNVIPKEYDIVFQPIDIPLLNKIDLLKIASSKKTIAMPFFEEKNGHPIKLSFSFCNNLRTLTPTDSNHRLDIEIKKIDSSELERIEVMDFSINKNLNTPKDWSEYINKKTPL